MDNNGYIRTLEAVIAIVIILLFIFAVTPERLTNPKAVPPQVESAQNYILKNVSDDPVLRAEAINAAEEGMCNAVAPTIDSLVAENVPPGFAYSCAVCPTTSCVFTPEGVTTSIYMDDIMITPNDVTQSPKIIRIWFWPL